MKIFQYSTGLGVVLLIRGAFLLFLYQRDRGPAARRALPAPRNGLEAWTRGKVGFDMMTAMPYTIADCVLLAVGIVGLLVT